jgi:hypothetical protein
MSILHARSRLVSFRLTQNELEDLRVACLLKGARNVSEFARDAVLQRAEATPEAQLLDRFSNVETRLNGLEQSLKTTTDSLQGNADLLRVVLKNLLNRLSEKDPAEPRISRDIELVFHSSRTLVAPNPLNASDELQQQAQGA